MAEHDEDSNAHVPIIDPVLGALVHVTNETHTEMGVTLLVGGSWLAGMLTWPRRWITVWGERIRAGAGEQGAGLAAGFDYIGRMWFPSDSEREAMEGDLDVVPPREGGLGPFHLHLLDAKLLMPNGWVPREGGAHLRVRLDRVSAWMVGTLGSA